MYTVEFEQDAAIITVMCEKDEQEDVQVIIQDNGTTYIRQFQEFKNEHDVIVITYLQLLDIVSALKSPEGIFRRIKNEN